MLTFLPPITAVNTRQVYSPETQYLALLPELCQAMTLYSVPPLPLELLEVIFSFVSPATQLSLCHVSKLFHSLSTRIIYRKISLSTAPSIVRCCRTLASKPTAAAAVRTFSLTYTPPDYLSSPFASFYKAVREALQCMHEVRELELLVTDNNFSTLVAKCSFPRLRRFECFLALTRPLVQFLNGHPDISYLQLAPHEDLSLAANEAIPPVSLPKLQYFVGNSECVPIVVRQASLRAAFVSWDVTAGGVDDAFAALEESSNDTLSVVSCRRRGWNADLIDIVSKRLPDIYVLSVTNVLLVDSHPSDGTLDKIKSSLSRFTNLQRLVLHCLDLWDMGDVECRMDHDYKTVTAWGEICPSLAECTLPHGLKWLRLREDTWLPDPLDSRGSGWLWNMIYSKQYPDWHKVLDTMEQRVRERTMDPSALEGTIAQLRAWGTSQDESVRAIEDDTEEGEDAHGFEETDDEQ